MMAKGTAICTCATCGSTFKVEATKYNRDEANQWEAWAERNYTECKTCYATRKQAERAAENEEASAKAQEQGLPELTGSPKQIAWAETIRMAMLEKLSAESEKEGGAGEWENFIAWVKEEYTSARYWIDNRGENVYSFMLREVPIYKKKKGISDEI